jgi:hypothetical protein
MLLQLYVDSAGIMTVKFDQVPGDIAGKAGEHSFQHEARIDLCGKNFNWITLKDPSNPGDAIILESDLGGAGVYYLA